MIAVPYQPLPNRSNAIIRVTVHNVNTLTFLSENERARIGGQIRTSRRAWLDFNFYSPGFEKTNFSWPRNCVCMMGCVFIAAIIAVSVVWSETEESSSWF